jgi:hypothetical protein
MSRASRYLLMSILALLLANVGTPSYHAPTSLTTRYITAALSSPLPSECHAAVA